MCPLVSMMVQNQQVMPHLHGKIAPINKMAPKNDWKQDAHDHIEPFTQSLLCYKPLPGMN